MGTDEEVKDLIDRKEDYYLSYPIKKANKHKLRWIDAPQGKLKSLQYYML